MAKRKSAVAPKSAAERTTAAVFVNGSQHLDLLDAAPDASSQVGSAGGAQFEAVPDDTNLPFKLIYQFQDLLNENMDLAKGVQVLLCLYLSHIFYLYLSRNGFEEAIYSAGFNILGDVLAMFLSHRSQRRKHDANPDLYPKPSLPAFNTIYSLFIPILFILLMSDYKSSFYQANLALSNFAVKSLHPIAKVVSAFVFYYMYNDEHTLEIFQFLKVIWVYFSVDYSLNSWNESTKTDKDGVVTRTSTLSDSEIHFIAMACVNFLGQLEVLPLTTTTTPLFILRVLLLSLIISLAASYPLYELYKWLGSSVVTMPLSVVIVGVFCGAFYYATDYQFRLFVAPEEVFHWLYKYITESSSRTKLLSTWLVLLAGTVPVMFILSKTTALSLNMRRKVWHFLLVGTLTYPLVQDPDFVTLAVMGSIIVFVAIEFLRCTQLTFLGKWLDALLRVFQDDKDLSGPLNLSYIFLLVGVAIPLAYSAAIEDPISIRSYIGLATLGLGDSFASIVGKNFGKTKWRGSNKTLEGSVAYVLATFAYFAAVDFYVLPESQRVNNWENLLIVSIVSGIAEGTASLNDNILVPAITLITFEILTRVFP